MSAFGTPVIDFSGQAAFSPFDSTPFAVADGDLIVVLSSCSNGGAIDIEDLDNTYTLEGLQTALDGSTYQWGYVLSAIANPSEVVTITPAGGGQMSLFIWVVPLSAAVAFDVLFGVNGVLAAASLTGAQTTTGSDEMCFCGVFDKNAVGGWTTPSPGVLDSAGFPATARWAGMHIQFAAPQTALQLEMDNAGGVLGGGITGIAFKGSGSPPPPSGSPQPVVVLM